MRENEPRHLLFLEGPTDDKGSCTEYQISDDTSLQEFSLGVWPCRSEGSDAGAHQPKRQKHLFKIS